MLADSRTTRKQSNESEAKSFVRKAFSQVRAVLIRNFKSSKLENGIDEFLQ